MPVQEPVGQHVLDFVSHSAAQTYRLGVRMALLLQPGDVLLLAGEFGAGKTTFIQGVAEGLGVDGPVASPSFTLIWEYRADEVHDHIPFYHIDLYRIQSPEEAFRLAVDEYLYGAGVCAVEWADRIPEIAPEEHLCIHLALLSETKRVVRMEPVGQRYIELLEAFKRSAFG